MKLCKSLIVKIWIAQLREVAFSWLNRYGQKTGIIYLLSKLNYSAALEKARMDAITTAVGNAGKLWIYSGTQPAGPGTTHSLTLLAGPFTLGSPFAPGATTANPSVLSPTLPSNVNASATGTPTWGRVSASGGTDGSAGIMDYSAGASGADITIGGTTSGQPVAITAWSQTSAQYGH